jgi:hypothetical protein
MDCMRGSRLHSRAGRSGPGRALVRLAAIAFVLFAAISVAHAQSPTPTPTPTPTPSPTPSPTPTVINSTVSSGAALTNLGSSFLERMGNQASNGFNRLQRTNPGGGGASESTEGPRSAISSATAGRHGAGWPASARGWRPASISVSPSTRAVRRLTFRWRCSRQRST